MADVTLCDRCNKSVEKNMFWSFTIHGLNKGEIIDLCRGCKISFKKWLKRR